MQSLWPASFYYSQEAHRAGYLVVVLIQACWMNPCTITAIPQLASASIYIYMMSIFDTHTHTWAYLFHIFQTTHIIPFHLVHLHLKASLHGWPYCRKGRCKIPHADINLPTRFISIRTLTLTQHSPQLAYKSFSLLALCTADMAASRHTALISAAT